MMEGLKTEIAVTAEADISREIVRIRRRLEKVDGAVLHTALPSMLRH